MTRREEQIIEAGVYHLCGSRPPKTCGHNMHELAYINRNLVFEAGAKWADENPNPEMVNKQKFIENACEWLRRNYTNYIINDLSKYIEDVCSFDIFDDLLVEHFREAMEE